LQDEVDQLAASGDLPIDFGLSPGSAHYPVEATDAETLFRIADERLYAAKRGKR